MKLRRAASIVLHILAGVGSFAVTGYGVYSYTGADFHQDTLKIALFCILPVLSLPVFLLSIRSAHWPVMLHCALALAYLGDYSLLDWRTCASHGYCQGTLAVIAVTLTAQPVQAYLAAAVLNLAAHLLRKTNVPTSAR